MDLAEELLAGVQALERADAESAAKHLRIVVMSSDIQASPDLADVLDRARSLYAQALLTLGNLPEADHWCREALRSLRHRRDEAGLRTVRSLQTEIATAMAREREQEQRRAEQTHVSNTPVGRLLVGITDPLEKCEVLNRKAAAEIDAGRAEHAATLARSALRQALKLDTPHQEVLARINLARAEPSSAHDQLCAALERADATNEFNLVSLIARTAELTDTVLPVLEGPADGSTFSTP